MNADGLLFLVSLISMLLEIAHGTIMCSSCRSDTHPNCEADPPPPQPCPELGSDGVESCSTIRIFKKDTDELTQFLRSCSDSIREDCFDSRPGYYTCAKICYTDGCNAGAALETNSLPSLIALSLLFCVLFVKIKNGTG